MIRYLKKDRRYAVETREDSNWSWVFFDGETLGLVMNMDTARQVVYTHIKENDGACEYLCEDDFTEEK